jgi:hypothetical protein
MGFGWLVGPKDNVTCSELISSLRCHQRKVCFAMLLAYAVDVVWSDKG